MLGFLSLGWNLLHKALMEVVCDVKTFTRSLLIFSSPLMSGVVTTIHEWFKHSIVARSKGREGKVRGGEEP